MASRSAAPDAESTPMRPGAIKDRECPYCHEFFTSSSLGRHLDQFIKEDKPKPPDGKHNLEEIQRLRGGVTRRQARNSSARRNAQQSPSSVSAPPPAKKPRINGPDVPLFPLRPSWQATGVITDMSPTGASTFFSGTKYNFEDEQRQFAAERTEGRAAKLALTELVDVIKSSLAHPIQPSPFAFNFLASSFPTLVIHLLPNQPTINSSEVIVNPDCWPIDPPDESHLKMLREIVKEKLKLYRQELHRHRTRQSSEDDASERSHRSPDTTTTESDLAVFEPHLEAAYEAYAKLSSAERVKNWHLSALRAFVQEEEAHKATQRRLQKAEQFLAHQEAQVKRLNSIQQPREYILNPPSGTPLPPAAMQKALDRMLGSQDSESDPALLNADALIDKWKPQVLANRGFQRSLLSVLEAAATAIAAAEAHVRSDREDSSVDGVDDNPADGEGRGEGRPSGNSRRNAPNGNARAFSSSAGIDATGVSTRQLAPDGDSIDASGEDDADAALPTARDAALRGAASELLDPILRGGKHTGKDPGEFGAEDLLDKIGSLAGTGTASGGTRRRTKR